MHAKMNFSMVKQLENKILVAPFSLNKENLKNLMKGKEIEKLIFSVDLELSTIFILAENERKKGSKIKFRKEESLISISRLLWPLWMISLGQNRWIIFDSIPLEPYREFKIVETFDTRKIEEKLDISTPEDYLNAIFEIIEYINRVESEQSEAFKIQINALLDPILVENLKNFLFFVEEREISGISPTSVFMPSIISEEEILSYSQPLVDYISSTHESVEEFNKTVDLIEEKTRSIDKKLEGQITTIREKYDKKIDEISQNIEKDLNELQNEMESKIKELRDIEKEEIQKIIKILASDLEPFEHTFRCIYVDFRETRNKLENESPMELFEEIRPFLDEIKSQLSNSVPELFSDFINKLYEKEIQINNIQMENRHLEYEIREEYQEQINELRKDIILLEEEREQEIKQIEDLKSKINFNHQEILEKLSGFQIKYRDIDLFRMSGILENLQWAKDYEEKVIQVYVPLYIGKYIVEEKEKERFLIFPPMLGKTKRRWIGKKLVPDVLPLAIASDVLDKNLKKILEGKLEKEEKFREMIKEAILEKNLLTNKESQELFFQGLKKLRELGWITDIKYKDYNVVYNDLFRSFR